MNNKQLIGIVEKKGFEIKGKSKDSWKVCYTIEASNEKHELTVSPVSKKQLIKGLLKDIEYWKFIGIEEASSRKEQKEIEKVINKMKKLIGEINETK